MSRSFKKTPIIKNNDRGLKKIANRKVRRTILDMGNNSYYKKIFSSYDICDVIITKTYKEYIADYEQEYKAFVNGGLGYQIKQNCSYADWYTDYKMK